MTLLDSATQRRCTLLTAPAGWGKTTLLAAWAGRKGATRPVAWLSLDRGDDDPPQFWSYLVAAIRAAVPDDDRLPLTTLRPPRKLAGIDGFLADLVNALHDLTVAPVLVIDDVQLLTDRSLLAGLPTAELRTPTLSVILAGRHFRRSRSAGCG